MHIPLCILSPRGLSHSFKGLGVGKRTSQGDLKSLVCLMSSEFQIPFCFLDLSPMVSALACGNHRGRRRGGGASKAGVLKRILPVKSTERNSKNPGFTPDSKMNVRALPLPESQNPLQRSWQAFLR